jgi:hypothetical protein
MTVAVVVNVVFDEDYDDDDDNRLKIRISIAKITTNYTRQ